MERLDIINKKEINITSDSIESVVSKLNENRKFLYNVPIQAIILILDRFSKMQMRGAPKILSFLNTYAYSLRNINILSIIQWFRVFKMISGPQIC